MNDKELTGIFDKVYNAEYTHNFQQLNCLCDQARDKLYATSWQLE